RGPVRVELAPSFDTALGLLEWRSYELFGAFYHARLAVDYVTTCALQSIQPQLIMFGRVLRQERDALHGALLNAGLPPPIMVGEQRDDDPAPFWRSLVSSVIVGTPTARLLDEHAVIGNLERRTFPYLNSSDSTQNVIRS
ncbi:MAG: hypothetical protein ACREPC_01790, partial [Stenotrophomonas sp.]